jgi:hypothetical protein
MNFVIYYYYHSIIIDSHLPDLDQLQFGVVQRRLQGPGSLQLAMLLCLVQPLLRTSFAPGLLPPSPCLARQTVFVFLVIVDAIQAVGVIAHAVTAVINAVAATATVDVTRSLQPARSVALIVREHALPAHTLLALAARVLSRDPHWKLAVCRNHSTRCGCSIRRLFLRRPASQPALLVNGNVRLVFSDAQVDLRFVCMQETRMCAVE